MSSVADARAKRGSMLTTPGSLPDQGKSISATSENFTHRKVPVDFSRPPKSTSVKWQLSLKKTGVVPPDFISALAVSNGPSQHVPSVDEVAGPTILRNSDLFGVNSEPSGLQKFAVSLGI